MKFSSRRNFLKFGGVGLASVISPQLLAHASKTGEKNKIPKNITILMQGDSITDAGRDKSIQKANDSNSLGRGYVYQISSDLLGAYPNANLKLINRGGYECSSSSSKQKVASKFIRLFWSQSIGIDF